MLVQMCRSPPPALHPRPAQAQRQPARPQAVPQAVTSNSSSWPSTFNQALDQLDIRAADGNMMPNPLLQSHPQPFMQAYDALCQVEWLYAASARLRACGERKRFVQEAVSLGIPAHALPAVSRRPEYEELRDARDHLRGIMDSFMSANI